MSAALQLPEPHASEINDLADQLAEAMTNASAASQVLSAAEAHRDKIAARISELAGRRGEIAARRASGRDEADDGPQIALIGVDTESLQSMMPDAAARVAEAKRSFDHQNALAARLRGEIGLAEALAAREVLVAHAEALGDKLLETVKAIAAAGQRAGVGGRPPWGPAAELRNTLRKISLARGEG
jgi:chromosome segregation ATPase